MRDELYPTFTDLLLDMEFVPAFDSQVIDILIRLGHFRELGSTGKLLKLHSASCEGEIRFSKLVVEFETYFNGQKMHHDDIARAVADIVEKSIGSAVHNLKVSI